jgi:hypothetical protein
MRLLVAAAIAASVFYFWDTKYNDAKLADGAKKMAGSMISGNR